MNTISSEIKELLTPKYGLKNIRVKVHKNTLAKDMYIDIYNASGNEEELETLVIDKVLKGWGFKKDWDSLSVRFHEGSAPERLGPANRAPDGTIRYGRLRW